MNSSDTQGRLSGAAPWPPRPENWRTLLQTGANMLIVGPRCDLDAFLGQVGDAMAEPVRFVRPSESIPRDERGTLVLLDAATLDPEQRDELHAWFCDGKRVRPQVISLTESHLWRPDAPPLVPLDLYYRLNTICLVIRD
ncbi:MAG TPA: hypothetical protein VLV86_12795 [Vicinamibacterales bacterium]|nr:hypothetical protein [Vicinamibacterales bacterium]